MNMLQSLISLVGRVAISQIFILAGWDKMYKLAETAKDLDALGIPMSQTVAIVAVVMSLMGGLLVLMGWGTRFGALLLSVLVVAITYYTQAFWGAEPEQAQALLEGFMMNLTILGGTIYIIAFGAGGFSIDGRKRSKPYKEKKRNGE